MLHPVVTCSKKKMPLNLISVISEDKKRLG